MAKNGINKLTKLKSAIKKWPSFSKLTRSNSSINSSSTSDSILEEKNSKLHSVYVGKSRRRYLLSSEVVFHPLFQELIERSGGSEEGGEDLVVANCEVVLFEHFLWMLEGGGSHFLLGSMEELAEFYYTS